MISLGPLAFAAPWALAAFAVLPLLWLLLRATPPAPARIVFAPLRLLQNLARTPETPQSTPWWLLVLRLVMASLVILALARPILSPQTDISTDRPLLLLVDDGWRSAPGWPQMQAQARSQLIAARSEGRDVLLVFTAAPASQSDLSFGPASNALARLNAHELRAWPPARDITAERLETGLSQQGAPERFDTVWISDGVSNEDHDRALARVLSASGPVTIILPEPERTAIGLTRVGVEPDGFTVRLVRADSDAQRPVTLTATGADGQALARLEGVFEAGEQRLDLSASLPLDLRNQISRLALDRFGSAGATHITGDRWRRPRVGLLTPETGGDRQPLLSDYHYAREALAGSTELVSGDLDTLLGTEPSALVMVDNARLEDDRLTAFVEAGGVLIRFSGPNLATRADDLLPVRLREGGRLFGGAMAWEDPQGLAPFPDESPFTGLEVSSEAQVTRQVLAEPGPDLDAKVWARLEDGTPLVTADRRGQGWIVLFHVTAGPDWSSLPLSGLYPAMLERVLSLSGGADPTPPQGGAWGLERQLTADGLLTDPTGQSQMIAADQFTQARASAQTPPGVWSLGAASAALNVMQPGDDLALMARDLPGATYRLGDGAIETRLAGPLLSLALILLCLDGLITLVLSGRMPFATRNFGAVAVLALALGGMPQDALAQGVTGIDQQALEVRLAYVRTGDARIDELSRAGLAGLSRESTRRSAVEPSTPAGVDIETDEILFYPMIYWPVTEDAQGLSPEAAARVTAYMNAGGLIVFDTRDGRARGRGLAPHPGLVRLLDSVEVPPLQQMPDDHVLGRAFYLLTEFPGRYPETQIWVEANPESSGRDGASSVVIGSADWASAWAIDEQGRPLAPVEGGPRQRELAIRFGVNLAMYALTGNYKADQVHVPAILERLGQD
ncbi:DUF4159 domain-containing protein [Oceanicaulis sp.]|uniref:DUF4159 domain-containing protein n=1 Tax=Oceanicaulis sp. TaxID=1924941 RepID=UPI003F701603